MTQHSVRQLTSEGIAYAKRFLNDAREGRIIDVPDDLLTDDRYAKPTATECYIENRQFDSRRDAGEYLARALAPLGIGSINGNYPLWSWLGLFFLDSLVGRSDEGYLEMGTLPDYAFIVDPQKTDSRVILFNRLMLAWETYTHHGDEFGEWMLNQPVDYIPRLVNRTIGSRQRFSSSGIIKLVGMLYIDPQTSRIKRGAADYKSSGNIRRLYDVLDQLYMTYDVYGMRAEQLLALLPEEFKRFNSAAGSARS